MRALAALTLLVFAAGPAGAAQGTAPPAPDAIATPPATPSSATTPAPDDELTPAAPSATELPARPAPSPAAPAPSPPKPATASSAGYTVMPDVPEAPVEPMPEWTPPPPTERMNRHARFVRLSPQAQQGQQLRQAGLWISGVGWTSLLAGGICYARTSDNNLVDGISSPGAANAELQHIGMGLIIGGGVVAVGGVALFTAGQWQISSWHKKRPTDPMPSMSGF